MAVENKAPNTVAAADAQADIAADVDAIMRKYDRESNTRIWTGKPKFVVNAILVIFSLIVSGFVSEECILNPTSRPSTTVPPATDPAICFLLW